MFEWVSKYNIVYALMVIIFGALYMPTDAASHVIEVLHPGISRSDKVERVLYAVDQPHKEYYMKVATVVCGDDQCKIDTISIFWDTLGFYNRIELPYGVYLEKSEGDHFTNQDYEKLDAILANRTNSLIDVYKEEVVGSESSDAVDGVSGATIILNTNDYVAGAVWTCYTLWHWANGNVYQIIRDIEGTATDLPILIRGVRADSEAQRHFALEQLERRGVYTDDVLESLLRETQSYDSQYVRSIIQYLESTGDHTFYFKGIEMSLRNLSQSHSARLLSSLLGYPKQPDLTLIGRLIEMAQKGASYQEVDLILRLLDKNEDAMGLTISYALGLLESDQFLIARRAYWYLDRKDISKAHEEVLRDFHTKNSHRL